jgi:hypothetical protein
MKQIIYSFSRERWKKRWMEAIIGVGVKAKPPTQQIFPSLLCRIYCVAINQVR